MTSAVARVHFGAGFVRFVDGDESGPAAAPPAPAPAAAPAARPAFDEASQLECAVCLSSFERGETLLALPRCRHRYHAACVLRWLSEHRSCPVCKDDVVAAVTAAAGPRAGSAQPQPRQQLDES